MKKYSVYYSGSPDGDYMLVEVPDSDGDMIELYAVIDPAELFSDEDKEALEKIDEEQEEAIAYNMDLRITSSDIKRQYDELREEIYDKYDLDTLTFDHLKDEIIDQAIEAGIDPKILEF